MSNNIAEAIAAKNEVIAEQSDSLDTVLSALEGKAAGSGSGGGDEKWEKIADINILADTSMYILGNLGTYHKIKVMMDREVAVTNLSKNVWFRVRNGDILNWYTITYLALKYGYIHWEVTVEVSNLFICGSEISSNNLYASTDFKSNISQRLDDVTLSDLDFYMNFTDTSVIQDGDIVSVYGVRK